MKARISQEPRCVLLWQVEPGSTEYAAVEHAARLSRLKVRLLTEADLDTTIEALCSGSRCASSAAGTSADLPKRPAMIVSGLRHDNGDLGQFVDEVRRGGASIPLRAMVTPTSRSWTLAALLIELNREHDEVGGSV